MRQCGTKAGSTNFIAMTRNFLQPALTGSCQCPSGCSRPGAVHRLQVRRSQAPPVAGRSFRVVPVTRFPGRPHSLAEGNLSPSRCQCQWSTKTTLARGPGVPELSTASLKPRTIARERDAIPTSKISARDGVWLELDLESDQLDPSIHRAQPQGATVAARSIKGEPPGPRRF